MEIAVRDDDGLGCVGFRQSRQFWPGIAEGRLSSHVLRHVDEVRSGIRQQPECCFCVSLPSKRFERDNGGKIIQLSVILILKYEDRHAERFKTIPLADLW